MTVAGGFKGFFNAVRNFIVKECIWSLRQVRKRQE